MKDGHLNKCKRCTQEDVSRNYRKNIDHYKAYERSRNQLPHRVTAKVAYQKTEQGQDAHGRASKKYRRQHPNRAYAHQTLGNAIRDGRVQRQPCFICGIRENVQGHHYDYSKPLSVIWFCENHHLWLHGKEKIMEAA